MRIVQITDTHIGAEGENTRDVDVRVNFVAMLEVALRVQPDYLVFTGDLCYDTSNTFVYNWIKTHLDALALPYDLIPGNHDDPALMARVFEREHLLLPDGEMAFVRPWGGLQFFFLDTSPGFLSEAQADWLQHKLSGARGRQVIFMHHPPLPAGMPFMDGRYPLLNPDVFRRAVAGYADPVHVFCGHYHIEKTVHEGALHVHITPSTFFQIDPFNEKFAVDHYRPALRVIDIDDEGRLLHSVRYLDVAGW